MTEAQRDLFPIGVTVNVEWREGDLFNHGFSGEVKGYHGEFVTVSDQDGDCWDCVPDQLSYNTDAIMHD